MSDQWQGLNERQQKYMQAIYEVDQEQEEWEKGAYTRGDRARKAEVWRWIDYATFGVLYPFETALKQRIRILKLADEGTGSTFNALESRGFIVCRYMHVDRDEAYTSDERFLSLQITQSGRKLVRTALGITPVKRKPGELTENQQVYADKIIAAGIAPREEVENAFRSKESKDEERIHNWGSTLGYIQRREREKYEREHPIIKQCAVCNREIVIARNVWEVKSHIRFTEVEYNVAGISWGSWSGIAEQKHDRYDFYACCPEHAEKIKYAEVKVSVSLVFNEDEEQRIKAIQYPVEARDTVRDRLGDDVRLMAWRDVAEAEEQALVRTRKKIATKAQQSLDTFIAASDTLRITDNLEMFNDIYVRNYIVGYKDALNMRQSIDEGNSNSYQRYDIWLEYYRRTQKASNQNDTISEKSEVE
jgi:hypothetical protein